MKRPARPSWISVKPPAAREGAVQEVKGKGEKKLGDAKQAARDAINRAAEAANKKL